MERAAHILQQLGKLYRRHRFQIRHRSRSLETKKDVSPMVWEKSIGIEKVGAAKWIKQSFLLRARYLDLMAAPSLHGLNAPAHLSPRGGATIELHAVSGVGECLPHRGEDHHRRYG